LRGVQLIGAPDPLTAEIQEVLRAGYLRGADCWHVAAALTYSPDRSISFLSLGKAQLAVAARLGFSA
jgi:hypothetical protein